MVLSAFSPHRLQRSRYQYLGSTVRITVGIHRFTSCWRHCQSERRKRIEAMTRDQKDAGIPKSSPLNLNRSWVPAHTKVSHQRPILTCHIGPREGSSDSLVSTVQLSLLLAIDIPVFCSSRSLTSTAVVLRPQFALCTYYSAWCRFAIRVAMRQQVRETIQRKLAVRSYINRYHL